MELIVEGLLGPNSMLKIKDIVLLDRIKDSLFFFTSYTNVDVFLGQNFNWLLSENGLVKLEGEFIVLAITNQLCKPMDVLPAGYKGICQIGCLFKNFTLKSLYTIIPTVENWYESDNRFTFKLIQ